jgi:hypothetical protein
MASYSQLGKFPGWVADTFRTWWIWMPWMYSCLDNEKFAYTPYLLPGKPPHKWNGYECGQFLKSRGYPGYSKLKAQEKKAVVIEMMNSPNWPPPAQIPSACAITSKQLQTMLWHCHALFKNMFAAPHCPSHQHAADAHAKMLLSTLTELDRTLHACENLPNIYEVKYNFISLPRAVRLLAVYGSARNIQEGGIDGEGVVKMLRPLTPRGLKQHFARNLLDAFHRDQQLEELCNEVSSQMSVSGSNFVNEEDSVRQVRLNVEADLSASDFMETDDDGFVTEDEDSTVEPCEELHDHMLQELTTVEDDESTTEDIESGFFAMDNQQCKRYKSVQVVKEYQKAGLPLSFVITKIQSNLCIGLVTGTRAKGYLIPITIGDVAIDSTDGFPYFNIEIEHNRDAFELMYCEGTNESDNPMHHSVLNYGHLLPHLASLENTHQTCAVPYAVVTVDANHLNTSFEFV